MAIHFRPGRKQSDSPIQSDSARAKRYYKPFCNLRLFYTFRSGELDLCRNKPGRNRLQEDEPADGAYRNSSPGRNQHSQCSGGKNLETLNYVGLTEVVTTLRQGSNTFLNFLVAVGNDLDGPCTLQLSRKNTATTVLVMSYTFAEDFVAFPELGYLQTPKGDFEIVVEKTTNLTNWFPVLSHNTTSDQRAYYRFRIAK